MNKNQFLNHFNRALLKFSYITLLFLLGVILIIIGQFYQDSLTVEFPTIKPFIPFLREIGIVLLFSPIVFFFFHRLEINLQELEKKLEENKHIIQAYSINNQANSINNKDDFVRLLETDEDSKIVGEYFSEIFELNKKMEKEQKEIAQIKSETSQIAYETQEILSVLRRKVGIN